MPCPMLLVFQYRLRPPSPPTAASPSRTPSFEGAGGSTPAAMAAPGAGPPLARRLPQGLASVREKTTPGRGQEHQREVDGLAVPRQGLRRHPPVETRAAPLLPGHHMAAIHQDVGDGLVDILGMPGMLSSSNSAMISSPPWGHTTCRPIGEHPQARPRDIAGPQAALGQPAHGVHQIAVHGTPSDRALGS